MNKVKFVSAIAQSNNLSKEDTVILEYGLKKITLLLEDAVFTIAIGCLLRITALSIIFQISFMFLRMYAGGFHSKTELRCKIHSAIITVISLTCIRILVDKSWWNIWSLVLVSIVVMILAPVEAKNKPLSAKERKINHNKTVCIAILLNLIAAVSRICHLSFFYAIAVAVYAVFILMIMGIQSEKNYKRKRREKSTK